jgi:hypothetical protein
MPRNPADVRSVISDELGDPLTQQSLSQPGTPVMTPEEYQRQLEQLRRDIDRIQSDASRLAETQDPASVRNSDGRMTPLPQPLPSSPQAPAPQQEPGETRIEDLASTPEGISTGLPVPSGLRLYDPSAGSTGVRAQPPTEVGRAGTIPAPGVQTDARLDQGAVDKVTASRRVEDALRAVDTKSKFLGHPPGSVPGGAESQSPASAQSADRLRAASGDGGRAQEAVEVDPSRRASGASPDASRPGSSASLTQSQFDHYMAAAELYMQQGRYYRAVDSFTLALVYIPHDVRANLRKSQALLAAGEYLSSASFLARAIELDARSAAPNVAPVRKVNVVDAIGGPDAFVQRITDLEEHARTNDAPQLQFLLAYIYYQMDRRPEAQAAMEAARKGLPGSTALNLLEAAIGNSN